MATKATSKAAVEAEPEADTRSVEDDDPQIGTFAVSTKETDYVGRLLVTPGTASKDYLGRETTATTDHLGRLLLDVYGPVVNGAIEDRYDEIVDRVAANLHVSAADVWVAAAVDAALEYALIKTEREDVGLPDNQLTVHGLVGFSERLYMDAFSPNGVQVSVADPAFEPIFQPEHLWKHWRHYFDPRKVLWGVA